MTTTTTKKTRPLPMTLDLNMPFIAGNVRAKIYGGPFKNYIQGQRRLISVKMAEEIKMECDIDIPTEDFSLPDNDDMISGTLKALEAMADGNDIYAGCFGGIGRTGLFMGCMAKVMLDYAHEHGKVLPFEEKDPVEVVRKFYHPPGGHIAIETEAQQQFVRTFDTGGAIDFLNELPALSTYEFEQYKQVTERMLEDLRMAQRKAATDLETMQMKWVKAGLLRRLKFALRGCID